MQNTGESRALVPAASGPVAMAGPAAGIVPKLVADAGDRAARRFLELFAARCKSPELAEGDASMSRTTTRGDFQQPANRPCSPG
jgi:hypothetical protein